MPKAFTDCVKTGGKVVTKKLKGNKYIKICYDKKGNSHAGEVTKKKKASFKEQVRNSRAQVKSLLKLKEYYNENYHSE